MAIARILEPPASMPITDSTGETLDTTGAGFFDRPFSPDEVDLLADAVAAWLCSDHLRWLLGNVPGRRDPGVPPEPLEWPPALGDTPWVAGDGRRGLAEAVHALQEVCDWSRPGTVWDYRLSGERPLDTRATSPLPDVSATAVAERAAALGLCSRGRLRTRPGTLVVLGGRRMAPLNRARAAARAIRGDSLAPTRIVFLSASRNLDRAERESPEVRSYAAGARTETDLMRAAASCVFGVAPTRLDGRAASSLGELQLVETPAPDGLRRASTYDTLRLVADDLAIDSAASVGLVTSPTCRPFQYLDAARALGLELGISFELIAHPRAWAADPGTRIAAPHVYLQEIRSAVQAAGRLSEALNDDAVARPGAQPAAVA
jgi:hypothetical protein